ncbi:hypothetical protein BCON_0010g00410 [Botryotinia convoluta]|uniref:Uncharacterized protein n=1 Tax=Botryotinia convoluta TaxID=54673 RepID=A0A4Z1IRB2_9HELO|nr:hypothetical protein BCON_0010g00410 [Botryotinia convoluta]
MVVLRRYEPKIAQWELLPAYNPNNFIKRNLLKSMSVYQELTEKQSLKDPSNYSFTGHSYANFTWAAHYWISRSFAIAQGRKRGEISPKEQETSVVVNSKTTYPVGCNSVETTSAEQSALETVLPQVAERLGCNPLLRSPHTI